MLIHLLTIFLSFGSLFSALLTAEEKEATDQIWSAMGDRSQETIEYIQPLLAKLSQYPPLAYLGEARKPSIVAWILEEYRRIDYDQVNIVKELADVVIDIMSYAKPVGNAIKPTPNKCKIVHLCLREMAKCSVNLFEITDLSPTLISLFPKSTQSILAKAFPKEWRNLVAVFIKSICKHVENGFDITSKALRVEQLFEYRSFTADNLEMFFQKGLSLDHRCLTASRNHISLTSNWITIAFVRYRIDLAYVCFKRGQKVPESCFNDLPCSHNLDKKLLEPFAIYTAKKRTADCMQAVSEIVQDEQESYLKLVPFEVIATIIRPFVFDFEYEDALTAIVGCSVVRAVSSPSDSTTYNATDS